MIGSHMLIRLLESNISLELQNWVAFATASFTCSNDIFVPWLDCAFWSTSLKLTFLEVDSGNPVSSIAFLYAGANSGCRSQQNFLTWPSLLQCSQTDFGLPVLVRLAVPMYFPFGRMSIGAADCRWRAWVSTSDELVKLPMMSSGLSTVPWSILSWVRGGSTLLMDAQQVEMDV